MEGYLAKTAARSLSGFALWPKLELDPSGEIVVEARGPTGEHLESSWQTLLPLIAPRPLPVRAGDSVSLTMTIELEAGVKAAPRYTMEGVTTLQGSGTPRAPNASGGAAPTRLKELADNVARRVRGDA